MSNFTYESSYRPTAKKSSLRLEVRLSGNVEQSASGVSKSAAAKNKDKDQPPALMAKFAGVTDGVCDFGLDERLTASAGSGLARTLAAAADGGKARADKPGALILDVYVLFHTALPPHGTPSSHPAL